MVFLKNPRKVLIQKIVYKTSKGKTAKKIADATRVEVMLPTGKGGYKKQTVKLEVPKKLKTKKAKETFIREQTHKILKAALDKKRKDDHKKAKAAGRKYDPVKKLPKLKKKVSAQKITDRVLESEILPKKKQKPVIGWQEDTKELIPVIRRADQQRYFITKHEVRVSEKIELQDEDGFTQNTVYGVVEEILRQKLYEIFEPGARYYVRTLNEGKSKFYARLSKSGRKKLRSDKEIEGFSIPITTPIKNTKTLDKFIAHFMEEYRNAFDVYLAGALGEFYFRGVTIDEYREV